MEQISSVKSSRLSGSSSDEYSEDGDDSVLDETFKPPDEIESYSSTRSSVYSRDNRSLTSPLLKRKENVGNWKKKFRKRARNLGKAYEMHTASKKLRNERKMKATCTEKCKLKCAMQFSEDERKKLFSDFWQLGNIEKQRQYIATNIHVIQPKYRYVCISGGTRNPRRPNNAFFFRLAEQNIRVCKIFFMNTLDITSSVIRSVVEKKNKMVDVLLMEEDQRGKHQHQKSVDDSIKNGIKAHINSIPIIESDYTPSNTSIKHFICGSKSISDIYRDYVQICKDQKIPFGNYKLFYRIFTTEFNISFFSPKKDLCDVCTMYNNTKGDKKYNLKNEYDIHLKEIELSRTEKNNDKLKPDVIVAVYDFQAIMTLPQENSSVFYYKSKLNVFNFTIYDMKEHTSDCYVWDESHGKRGGNEINTCVLQFLKMIETDKDVIFYSDNCAGQQKITFILCLYLYAVQELNIRSITHKFLIKGHTQNEGDVVHSLIESNVKKQLESGPMYTSESFASVIRNCKKTGSQFFVHKMCFESFYDIKNIVNTMEMNISVNTNNETIKMADIKILKVEKNHPYSFFYKTSYTEANYKEAIMIKRKKQVQIQLKAVFTQKPGISDNKKKDLMDLVNKDFIPKVYKPFFESL